MNITHLFPTNASVDAHKNVLYTLSKTDNAQIKAVDIIIGDTSDDHKRQIIDKIPDHPTKTMDFYSQVSVATEAKYDLIRVRFFKKIQIRILESKKRILRFFNKIRKWILNL